MKISVEQDVIRVLFVCMGNICRSPTAHGIFQKLVDDAGLHEKIDIESAGTHGYHTGELPHATTRKAALKRGYELTSRAQKFEKQHLSDFDYVVTMGEDNYEFVMSLAENIDHKNKILPFITLCKSFKDRFSEVPDPYYGGVDGFELVLDICEEGCKHLLENIRKKHFA